MHYPEAVGRLAQHIKVLRGYGGKPSFDMFQASTILAIIYGLDKENTLNDLMERTK